jgi:hypothetical protein
VFEETTELMKKMRSAVRKMIPWISNRAPDSALVAAPAPEQPDYYAVASRYALERLREHGDFSRMTLLCCTARMCHLADYVAIFGSVHHSSIVETDWPPGRKDPIFHHGDFFDLQPLAIDCVISHATMHCVGDTRYGNAKTAMERAYQFPGHLRSIAGKTVPTFVTVAVNREERNWENNRCLSHDRVVKSFVDAGFALRDFYFDYLSGGSNNNRQFHNCRQEKALPVIGTEGIQYVVGTYYFS